MRHCGFEPVMKTGLKVFVVDDETVIAATLSIILNQSGFQAESFTNPVVAQERARTTRPDLVVHQERMPGMQDSSLLGPSGYVRSARGRSIART